jgi:hypothetical protein
MTPIIQIVRIVEPEGVPKPYRLIETFATSEGMRTRVCSGAYASFGQAEFQRQTLESIIRGGKS